MFRFGDFEVDPLASEVRRSGHLVHLEPQAFAVLGYLITHRDRVVSKMELLDAVWGHRHVSEAGITTRIKEVRRALDDDGIAQHTIKNQRGRGYRFMGVVIETDRSPSTPFAQAVLIGRATELADVRASLGHAPVVTVTGPGGVGKSTLARAGVEQLRESDAASVFWVELATVEPAMPVLPVLARKLSVELDGGRPDEAIRSIAALDAVVVLDNCEHVVDEVAAVLASLATSATPQVRILATSRVPLGVVGEVVIPVGPLPIEDACELFVARAGVSRPMWDPGSVPAEALRRLVAGLDRLPLTIEMAAARSRSVSFEELADSIDAGAPLLQVSHRSPARRHRSLESLVRGSAELLPDHLRDLFEAFSVFAGAVNAVDAAAVLGGDDTTGIIFDLASLSERSLLHADASSSPTRYSMLVTMRTVAAHWLESSGRAHELRRRHAHYWGRVLREIDDAVRTPEEPAARVRMEAIVPEVRVAYRWATIHDPSLASAMSEALFQCSYPVLWHEPAIWSAELLAAVPEIDRASRPGALLLTAGAAAHRGDLGRAREWVVDVLATATGRLRLNALEVAADIALYEGDLEWALEAAAELGRLGTEVGDLHAVAFGRVDAAIARAYAGDPEGAVAEVTGVDTDQFAPTDHAWLALGRGDALSAAASPLAIEAFIEALDVGASVGNQFVVSVALTSLATEYGRAGQPADALATFGRALAEYRRHGNLTHAVTAMRNLVGLLADLGDWRGAVTLASALSHDALRVSYGREADRIAVVLRDAEAQVDPIGFAEWVEAGRQLDMNEAATVAAELVEEHRA